MLRGRAISRLKFRKFFEKCLPPPKNFPLESSNFIVTTFPPDELSGVESAETARFRKVGEFLVQIALLRMIVEDFPGDEATKTSNRTDRNCRVLLFAITSYVIAQSTKNSKLAEYYFPRNNDLSRSLFPLGTLLFQISPRTAENSNRLIPLYRFPNWFRI